MCKMLQKNQGKWSDNQNRIKTHVSFFENTWTSQVDEKCAGAAE